jgi:putative transposase
MPTQIRCLQYRLNPTAEQERQFRQWAGRRRLVWNHFLKRRIDNYKATGKTLTHRAMAEELTRLKQDPDFAFLQACDSQALQQVLKDLDRAYVNFFQKRARFPKRKSRKRTRNTFRIPQRIVVVEAQVRLPKIGMVDIVLHRPLEDGGKSATFKQEATGHWHVSFVCHIQMPDVEPISMNNPVGIDLGLEEFVSLSTGQKEKAPRFYRKQQTKPGRAQKKVSRRFDPARSKRNEPQSRNYQKARNQQARLHAQVRQKRLDFLHKLTRRIVKEHDVIVIEDLDVAALATTKLRGHSKSWYDAAASTFRRLLAEKCEWHVKRLVVVDRWFASSKRCHVCHRLNKGSPFPIRSGRIPGVAPITTATSMPVLTSETKECVSCPAIRT